MMFCDQLLRSAVAGIAVAAALSTMLVANGHADTVVVYGATGRLGSKIATEALYRGHVVIGVSRNAASLTLEHENFSAVSGDVTSLESMLEIIPGADAVVISVGGNGPDNSAENSVVNQAALTFIAAARRLGESAPRVVQMGGGRTLYSNGVLHLSSSNFEEGTRQHGIYYGHLAALENYRAAMDVRWTVVSPPPGSALSPGERTGLYRVGENEILIGPDGEASLSDEDLAVAIIDEIENPMSIGKRITVGY